MRSPTRRGRSASRPHGREAQQGRAHRAPARAAAGPRAAARRDRRGLEISTEVREILRMAQHPVSLEKPIGEEEESELGDFAGRPGGVSVRHGFAFAAARGHRARAPLAPRARAAGDRARYGLRGSRRARSRRSGDAGVTRERIRQIENNTLKKLESLPGGPGSQGLHLAGALASPPARPAGRAAALRAVHRSRGRFAPRGASPRPG